MQSDLPMIDAAEEDGGGNNMGAMEREQANQRDAFVKKVKLGENEYVLLPIKV